MIGYITIGTSDMEKAKAFYGSLLEPLGAKVLFDGGRIAFIGKSMAEPCIAVCIPYDESKPVDGGNGNMVAIDAGSRENVDVLYNKAIELGATDDGPAGERMPTFYGGYVRDAYGNKVCFYKMG
jgi:catechol 2,3-dioxygenase-like lactoylglutathione lyase family enzyme